MISNSTNDFLVFLYNSFYSSRIQSFKNHHFLLYLHLAKKLAFFPFVIIKAEKFKSPHLIATYLEELAQLFNGFYNEIKIIETQDQDLLNSRIMLVTSVASTIKNGLSLLNIKTPKRM